MADFALLEFPKLISRKISLMEKSWNFHTVLLCIKMKLFQTYHLATTAKAEIRRNFILLVQTLIVECSWDSQSLLFIVNFDGQLGVFMTLDFIWYHLGLDGFNQRKELIIALRNSPSWRILESWNLDFSISPESF